MNPSIPSNAGITLTTDGQRVIPSSTRADGTTRREIRVRPGYRPPEDVEIYKNQYAETWKNRGSENKGVPGAAPVGSHEVVSSNKNAKRRAARKKAKEKVDVKPTADRQEFEAPIPSEVSCTEPNQLDQEKKAKSIRKKIRQAQELKSRHDDGENLLPEQLDKVMKVDDLVRQLNELGLE